MSPVKKAVQNQVRNSINASEGSLSFMISYLEMIAGMMFLSKNLDVSFGRTVLFPLTFLLSFYFEGQLNI